MLVRSLILVLLLFLVACGPGSVFTSGKHVIVVKHALYTDADEMLPALYVWDHPQDMHILYVPSTDGGLNWSDRIEAGLRQYRDEGRRVEDMPIRVIHSDLFPHAVEAVERLWAEGQPWRWVEDWS
jgi:hypothetical protein